MSKEREPETRQEPPHDPSEPTSDKRPVSEIVTDEGNLTQIKHGIGLFTIVGIGFGLTGAIGIRLLGGGGEDMGSAIAGGVFMLAVFAVMALSGPILGVFIGNLFSQRTANAYESLVSAFTSSAVGYVAMMIVAVISLLLFAPASGGGGGGGGGSGGGGFFDLGSLLLPLILMALPVGFVSAGIVYLNENIFTT